MAYTHPEIASVGKAEEQLAESGTPYRKGVFPFVANGRAKAIADTDGFAKVLADERTDRIPGVHVIGLRGRIDRRGAVAVEFEATSEDITIKPDHPTLAEVMTEAALSVDNRALHI